MPASPGCVTAAAMLVLMVLSQAAALDNGLGRTPPMGWSSWNCFGPAVDSIKLKQVADAMVASGVAKAGFHYLNLDDGWAVGRHNQTGQLLADPKLFPQSSPGANDGIKLVADYVHSKGLKFGIYTARGSRTCLGRPGSDGYERLDAATWAGWGVDYVKEDSCGGTTHGTVWEQYARMRDALNATGRPIYYSITQAVSWDDGPIRDKMHCYGLSAFTTKPWLTQGLDPTALANSYLVEYCNNLDLFGFTGGVPAPGGFLSQLDSQALLTFDNLTQPGAFSDMDMLQVCNGGQSQAEYRAQFSTFAILTSPLILGNDLRQLSPECAAIVLNKEVIAINQDRRVSRAKLVWQFPDDAWPPAPAAPPPLRQLGLRGQPPPIITAPVVLEPCGGPRGKSQVWTLTAPPGPAPGPGPMLIQAAGPTPRCLTYGGYEERNLGLAGCTGWDEPNVGGQSWSVAAAGAGPVHLRQTPGGGGAQKVLASFGCNVSAGAALEVCTDDGDDCGPGATACPEALLFNVVELRRRPGVPRAPRTADVQLKPALNASLCVTAGQLPHAAVNITLQLWAKPLASGAVAAVALNRGALFASRVHFSWPLLSIPVGTCYSVRDVWAGRWIGNYTAGFNATVQPHDVVMVVATPCD